MCSTRCSNRSGQEAIRRTAERGFPRPRRHITRSRTDHPIQSAWVMNIPFEEVVCCDFEFYGREGNRPTVVCLVAKELRSGRNFGCGRTNYRQSHHTASTAGLCSSPTMPPPRCVATWRWAGIYRPTFWTPMPSFVASRIVRRNNNHKLACCMPWTISSSTVFRAQAKEHWRDVVLRGPPWSAEEREGILDYCWTDTDALERLLPMSAGNKLGTNLIAR